MSRRRRKPPIPSLLTIGEVEGILGLSNDTVTGLVTDGSLPAVNVSRGGRATWRFRPCDVNAFIHSRLTVEPDPEGPSPQAGPNGVSPPSG